MSKLIEDYNFPKEIFGNSADPNLLWEVARAYLTNLRHGKASTKTKTEVAGGGRKPWRQKGTGRARHGSIRSPLWRGGGVVFGPKPKNYEIKISKKKKRKALQQILSDMYQNERIKVVEDFTLPEPKTKLLFDFLKSLEIENKKVLIVLKKKNVNIDLAARNIPNTDVELVVNLNSLAVLKSEYLLFTKEALDAGCKKWLGEKE